jgi:prepilin-type processing-associated H-X9-DG protein
MKRDSSNAAFAMREVLAVIAVLTLLAFLAGPGLALARRQSDDVRCLANLRQLHLAWANYANDYGGLLVLAGQSSLAQNKDRVPWIQRTNELETEFTIVRRSPLRPYMEGIESFLCPADRARRIAKTRPVAKARSYSMSQVFEEGNWLPNTIYRVYGKQQEIVAPARTFLLIDEHPDSINDGAFANEMGATQIIDIPAGFHNGGAGINFADGSAAIHKWRSRLFRRSLTIVFPVPVTTDTRPDLLWLAQRTTIRK